ncbi:Uu.00g013740.m01.CDS01 [Anthostomella pinea]|uniref:Uu.00g013740.m01.CDS01 n=1 Tax=Anthostomella pinea TaxID=933095 RepID=A0AAI8VYT2_9PEZI|nr:Uu.00g013740.m01.CDS01 [Anthostomella pinea]
MSLAQPPPMPSVRQRRIATKTRPELVLGSLINTAVSFGLSYAGLKFGFKVNMRNLTSRGGLLGLLFAVNLVYDVVDMRHARRIIGARDAWDLSQRKRELWE